MHTSRSRRVTRRLVSGAAAATVVLLTPLLAPLLAAPAGAAPAIPGPVAPQASPLELAGGSAQTLGGNIAGQVTGTGIGPSVLSGPGTGPSKYVALGDSYAAVGRI